MTSSETLSASLEDYLEAIFHIVSENQAARVKDISKRLQVNMSSVTGALKSLAEKGLVNYAPYELITLTEEGKKIAADVARRHEVLQDFFVKVLSVEESLADQTACKMEHEIPREILERFIQFIEFVEICPRGGADWIEGFGYRCAYPDSNEDCKLCVENCLHNLKSKETIAAEERRMSLSELKPGTRCKIIKVSGESHISHRLVEMGVTPGSLVEVERIAPLGDPIEIKVRGYHLSIRKREAAFITVEAF